MIPIVLSTYTGEWVLGAYARDLKDVYILTGQAFQAGTLLLGVHFEVDKPVYFNSWSDVNNYIYHQYTPALVMAGSYQQFLYYARVCGWKFGYYTYLDREDKLRGFRGRLIQVCTYYDNPAYNYDLWDEIKSLRDAGFIQLTEVHK